jgi:hypothetical protein
VKPTGRGEGKLVVIAAGVAVWVRRAAGVVEVSCVPARTSVATRDPSSATNPVTATVVPISIGASLWTWVESVIRTGVPAIDQN